MTRKLIPKDPALQGEGNYAAARRHRAAAQAFVKAGKVKAAAEAAEPDTPEQAQELREAEEAGRKPARG